MKRIGLIAFLCLWATCANAAPAFIGYQSGSVANGSSFTVSSTLITGTIQAGDQLFLIDCYSGGVPSFSGGNAWGTVTNTTNGLAPNHAWVTRVATSSEPASYTITGGANTYHTGVLLDYRNSNNVIDVSSTPNNQTTSSTPATVAVTTTLPNDMWIAEVCWNTGGVSMSTPPAGLTQRVNIAAAANPPLGVWIGDNIQTSAGSTGAPTGTFSASSPWISFSVALEAITCSGITQQSVCPQGRGISGVCDLGSDTINNLTNCYVCPASTPCTAHVTDASTTCTPGVTPGGSGSGKCSVAWNGSAWVGN